MQSICEQGARHNTPPTRPPGGIPRGPGARRRLARRPAGPPPRTRSPRAIFGPAASLLPVKIQKGRSVGSLPAREKRRRTRRRGCKLITAFERRCRHGESTDSGGADSGAGSTQRRAQFCELTDGAEGRHGGKQAGCLATARKIYLLTRCYHRDATTCVVSPCASISTRPHGHSSNTRL
jgi:hypothetical protein